MKILYVIPRLADAGTEKHLCMLAQGMQQEGIDVTVCSLFEGNYDVPDGFTFVCLSRKYIYDVRILVDLYLLMVRSHFDVVHAYLFGFNYLAVVPAKIAGVKLIVTSRRELASWKKFHHRLLENIANIFTDKVIACSEAAKKFALETEKYVKGKVAVIYNGVDIRSYCSHFNNGRFIDEFGLNDGKFCIGMIANFSRNKDHSTVIDAFSELKSRKIVYKGILVGDGPCLADIRREVLRRGLEEDVIFTGVRKDIPAILSAMHICVLTSRQEGLPNSILEAMACEVPVVAARAGGIPEIIQDGINGILFPPGDVDALVDSMVSLLGNNTLASTLGLRGKETIVRKFSKERMMQDYLSFYKANLGKNV